MSPTSVFGQTSYLCVFKRLVRMPAGCHVLGRRFAILEAVNIIRRVYVLALAGLLVFVGASAAVAAETYVESGLSGAGTHQVIIPVTPGHEADVLAPLQKHGSSV